MQQRERQTDRQTDRQRQSQIERERERERERTREEEGGGGEGEESKVCHEGLISVSASKPVWEATPYSRSTPSSTAFIITMKLSTSLSLPLQISRITEQLLPLSKDATLVGATSVTTALDMLLYSTCAYQ